MATTTLNIQGMTCNGCVNSVTRVLTGIAGVSLPLFFVMRFCPAFRLPILWRVANKRWLLFGYRIARWFRC